MKIRILCVLGLISIFFFVLNFGSAKDVYTNQEESKTIWFSGQNWIIDSSDNQTMGPGDNYFSDSEDTVWVDEDGWLHLKIRKEGKLRKWVCSSIHSELPADYGIHRFYVVGDLAHLDKNVVLGLFLYQKDPEHIDKGSEFDIEFSTWGLPKKSSTGEMLIPDDNMQYVLWNPWKGKEEPQIADMACYNILTGANQCTTHTLTWRPDTIQVNSCYGHLKYPKPENIMQHCLFQSTLQKQVIMPKQEDRLHIYLNLWLNEFVQFPSDKQEVEILIKYDYEPFSQG